MSPAPPDPLSPPCPACGGPMGIKHWRGGYFFGCRRYPACPGARKLTPEEERELGRRIADREPPPADGE